MIELVRGLTLATILPGALAAQEVGEPLSAIDWLSRSVEEAALAMPPPAIRDETPVAESAGTPDITVTSLDAPSPDPLGLLPTEMTGLPHDLWSKSPEAVLTGLIAGLRTESLPALTDLTVTLMLAEAAPPLGAGPEGALFLARVDRLLVLGALEPAQALIELANPERPEVFRRWFDIALLTGTEEGPCRVMADRPALSPTLPARIFCLARGGDWPAAALTLTTARALGDVTAEDEALLARFLDPDLFEGEPPLPPPERVTPLTFRLHEAVGEALPVTGLPLAFAHADLRPQAAWRNQIEAAERLARAGAISDNLLHAAYLARVPAASGGVWDRAQAVQRLETALEAGDPAAIGAALDQALRVLAPIRIDVPFARLYASRLAEAGLDDAAAERVFRLTLLTPDYERAALTAPPGDDAQALAALARGSAPVEPDGDPVLQAMARVFAPDAAPPPDVAALLAEGRLGEVLLRATARAQAGLDGDPLALAQALITFRAVGLEDVARRAALQYLLLQRMGG